MMMKMSLSAIQSHSLNSNYLEMTRGSHFTKLKEGKYN